MGRTISFVVPPRRDAPNDEYHRLEGTDQYTVPADRYSRHHIVGRKYLQLLQALWEEYGYIVYDDTRPPPPGGERHPTTPNPEQQRLAPATDPRVVELAQVGPNVGRPEFTTFLFWMPLNLFVGPIADYRTFDPGGGLEPVRPLPMPMSRWAAVRGIPDTMKALGIPVDTLVKERASGETFTFSVHVSDEVARKLLGQLLDALVGGQRQANRGNRVRPFRFHEDDWAVVNTAKDGRGVLTPTNAAQHYELAVHHKLIDEERDWAFVAAQPPLGPRPFRMVLRSSLSLITDKKRKR